MKPDTRLSEHEWNECHEFHMQGAITIFNERFEVNGGQSAATKLPE